jgi:predicted nucleic acid-binding protein
MYTAVDTNILIDIFGDDTKFGKHSAEALRKCMNEGSLICCDVVWVETATVFPNPRDFINAMHTLNIEFSSIGHEAAMLAAEAWRHYRKAGGKRERLVADFLIGAHALTQCERLLTRDRGFYRSYFKSLKIIDPSDFI